MEQYKNSNIEKFLEEVSDEYSSIIKQNSTNNGLTEKTNNFMLKVQDLITKNCYNELTKVQSLAKIGTDLNGEVVIEKQKGKEAEAEIAIQNLETCQQKYTPYLAALSQLSNLSLGIIGNQSQFCVNDCDDNYTDESKLKDCLRKCFDYNIKYANKAIEKILGEQVDLAVEQLNKL